jgi:hypothetical protein
VPSLETHERSPGSADPSGSTPGPRHVRRSPARQSVIRIGQWIVGTAVVVTVAVVLVAAVHTSLKTTASLRTPTSANAATIAYDQTMCLEAALHRDVPKGATVYIGDGTTQPSQLAAEVATLWAVPTPDRQRAQWLVGVVAGSECEGLTLQAVHQR